MSAWILQKQISYIWSKMAGLFQCLCL